MQFEERAIANPDTLIVCHNECTGCLDLTIVQGRMNIPADIIPHLKMMSEYDFKVCGNFPMDLIDMSSLEFDPDLYFRIVGKVINIDKRNGVGSVPLFYVQEWKKFHFDRRAWDTREDLNIHTQRAKIVHTVCEHFMFNGQHISSMVNILGKPDRLNPGEFIYDIEDEYSWLDIDPVSITYLVVRFDSDSIVTSRDIIRMKGG